MDLHDLVLALPEKYQPIFGRPELSDGASRNEEHRLGLIRGLYEKLRDYKGRNLRVLDLGCAQGFFSFSLAEMGAIVTGVDFTGENIALCKELENENPRLAVTFVCEPIQTFVKNIKKDDFDLVIGLSVWHHISFSETFGKTQNIISHLHNLADFHISELALDSEDLYWASALPGDPRAHFPNASFSKVVGMCKTHLGSVHRPLYFSSLKAALTNRGLSEIVGSTFRPHNLFPVALETPMERRYFKTKDSFIKVQLGIEERPTFTQSLSSELIFYNEAPKSITSMFPKVLSAEVGQFSSYIEFELVDGPLLLDYIFSTQTRVEDLGILLDKLLVILSKLEIQGYYQMDARLWNFMVDKKADLIPIDAGKISRTPDVFPPQESYILGVVSLVVEILCNKKLPIGDERFMDEDVLSLLSQISSAGIQPEQYTNVATFLTASWRGLQAVGKVETKDLFSKAFLPLYRQIAAQHNDLVAQHNDLVQSLNSPFFLASMALRLITRGLVGQGSSTEGRKRPHD